MLKIFACLLLASSYQAVLSQPEVKTSLGVLKGQVLKSRNGREYFAFTGIPFGQPPVRSLRFKPPLPAEPWTGILNATNKSPKCLQSVNEKNIGQEDCLYLNVFTPKISGSLPVLFHIHGGEFLMGEAGPLEHGAFFMDEDVVLVSIQYRLGLLGFFSLENEELPGNMGLKDMALALSWVHSEIRSFGGDSNLVTIFGISAGGIAAHYLCLSPSTRKLVKGCISESGVGGPPRSLKRRGEARAIALKAAKALDCPEKHLLSCLQNKTISQITSSKQEVLALGGGFGPSLEPVQPGAIIVEWPLENTNFPWIVGHTANEGAIRSGYVANFQKKSGLKLYLENYESYFPKEFNFVNNTKEKAKRIYERFFINNEPYKAVEEVHSEAQFIYPVLKAALGHTGPKYFYVFNYSGGPSLLEIIMRRKLNVTGVSHGDELSYLFNDPNYYKPDGWPSEEDVKFSQKLIKLWVNFAKTQNPSIPGEVEWEQFTQGRYLDLSNAKIEMKDYSKKNEIIKFWDSIFDE